MANATYEEVWNQVADSITAGAGGTAIEGGAVEKVQEKFRSAFQKRLQIDGAWDADRRNVLLAANELGKIAGAIARLRHATTISQTDLVRAADVTAQNCTLGVPQEGRWCS